MSSNKRCGVKSCQSTNNKLFRCPESRSLLKKWKSILEITEREFYVCELHFDRHFINYEKILSDEAVPTLFINENLSNSYCTSCSSPISEGYQVTPTHAEIYCNLFNNFTLTPGFICTYCNDQILQISDFVKIVEDNKRSFESLDVEHKEPIIKLEAEDYEIVTENTPITQDVLYLKCENESEEEEAYLSEASEQSKGTKIQKRPTKNNKNYKCEVCSSTICGRNKLIEHVKENHAIDEREIPVEEMECDDSNSPNDTRKPIGCDICREMFNDKKLLFEHFKGHFDKSKEIKCSECDKTYNDIVLLAYHKNCVHKEGNRIWCICYRIFDNISDMKKCRKSHRTTINSTDGSKACDECELYVTFETVRTLAEHKTNCHGNGRRFWCTGCGKLSNSKEENRKCRKSHYMPLKNVIVKCPDCDKKLTYDSLKMHQIGIHNTVRNDICDKCGKCFPSKSQLSQHMKIFHREKDENEFYECDLCPSKYKTKSGIFTHMNKLHNPKVKKINCPICWKKIYASLETHMKAAHPNNYDNGVRVNPETNRYHCPNCIRSFGGMKMYEIHVKNNVCSNFGKYEIEDATKLTGSTKGKFTCNICNAVRPSMTKLRAHMREMHSGPQTCKICGNVLKNVKQYKRHVNKIHKMSMKDL